MMKVYTTEQYLKMINESSNLKGLVEKLGKGYTEMKVASNIITFAKKGLVSKIKAAILLNEDYPQMIKFLSDNLKVKKIPSGIRKRKTFV